MVYRKNTRKPYKRSYKKVYRKSLYRRDYPMGQRYRTQTYAQSIVSSITSSASTDMLIAHKVKFSDLPNYADFQKLFQQYRILKFQVQWIPTHDVFDPNNGTTFVNVPLYHAIDYDQDATPTIAELLKFQNLKTAQLAKGFKKTVYPMTTYTGASSNEIKKKSISAWLDTTNADQYHNGIDIAIPQAGWGSTAMLIGYVQTKIWFQVRYLDGTSN